METITTAIETAAAPTKIYEALTTTAGHRGWWTTDCEIGRKVGDPAVVRFNPMGGGSGTTEMRFRIDTLAPGEAVEWTCTGESNNPDWQGTQLAFRLRTPSAGRTTVELVHSGFAARTPVYEACVKGWAHFMQSLKQYVETGTGAPHVR